MRVLAFLLILASSAAFAQTTNCYVIDGVFLSCRSQGILQQAAQALVTPELLQSLIDRLVHAEAKAISDGHIRVVERLSKMTKEELDSWNRQRVDAEAIREASAWLGRAPSQLAVDRWQQQRKEQARSMFSNMPPDIFAKPK